jgi:hypothetical protein
MKTLSVEEAAIIYSLQTERFNLMRKITSDPFDFGDEASIGCRVKSVNPSAEDQFGAFVGKLSGGYTVVIYDLLFKILGGHQFDTVGEMHKIWQVD